MVGKSRISVKLVVGWVVFSLLGSGLLFAQEQRIERTAAFKDWSVFAYNGGSGKICWGTTTPVKSQMSRKNARRGDIYLIISRSPRHGIEQEVSVTGGYPYKKQSEVTIAVDGQIFKLFTDKERAWSSSQAADIKLARALERGRTAVVKGISTRGTRTTDTFSLLGFAAALTKVKELCK